VVWRYEEAGRRWCLWETGCKERLVTLGKTMNSYVNFKEKEEMS